MKINVFYICSRVVELQFNNFQRNKLILSSVYKKTSSHKTVAS